MSRETLTAGLISMLLLARDDNSVVINLASFSSCSLYNLEYMMLYIVPQRKTSYFIYNCTKNFTLLIFIFLICGFLCNSPAHIFGYINYKNKIAIYFNLKFWNSLLMTLNDENWGGWVRFIDFTLREKEKTFYTKYLFKIACENVCSPLLPHVILMEEMNLETNLTHTQKWIFKTMGKTETLG